MLKIKIKRKRLLKENMDAAVSELRQLMSGKISKKEISRMEELVGDNEALISYVNSHAESLDLDDIHTIKSTVPRLNIYRGIGMTSVVGLERVRFLTRLEHLVLYRLKISDISPLSTLPSLEVLSLPYNNISDISPLSTLPSLEFLSLFGNEVYDISPLSNLKNLISLDLSDNDIFDISPLSNLKNLISLDLSDNDIFDISPLLGMKNLEDLHLEENPLEIDDVDELRGVLPNCEIYFHEEK